MPRWRKAYLAGSELSNLMQEAKPGDKQTLSSQCEPLLTVAEAHAEGKESFARSIATELFSDFLSVEERFAANKEATEQEVIDSLRQVWTSFLMLPSFPSGFFTCARLLCALSVISLPSHLPSACGLFLLVLSALGPLPLCGGCCKIGGIPLTSAVALPRRCTAPI